MKSLRLPSDCDRFLRAMALLTALLVDRPALAQDGLEVSFFRDQGSITLHAVDVPLDEVLDAIGEATGIEIIRHEEHETPVTIDLVDVRVKTALARLLGRRNYAMKEDSQTQLPVRVWLMSTADLEAIARIRESQRSAKEAEQASKRALREEATDFSELSRELRAELRALGEGESGREGLDKPGLPTDEQEEFLRMLDEMEIGDESR